jgi:trigger factor
MVERRIDGMVRDFEMRLMYQGMNLESFLQYSGQTAESLRERYREQALARAKAEVVMEAIAKAEGVEPTEEDIDVELQRYAESRQQPLEEIKKTLNESDQSYFADAAKVAKVLALLTESAVPIAEEKEEKK